MATWKRVTRWIGLATLATAAAACAGEPPPGPAVEDENLQGLVWVAPDTATQIAVDDPVTIAVTTQNPEARAVRFTVDGNEIAVCDPSQPEEDCKDEELWRWTTTLTAGHHVLAASFRNAQGTLVEVTREVDVLATPPAETIDPGASEDDLDPIGEEGLIDEGTGTLVDAIRSGRGYLDPNRPMHSVFGSYPWAVQGQRVIFPHARLDGSVAAVERCMRQYGASIRRYADPRDISRASVVATAIAESNCTNPRGSYDGLSSGPMQVTGSTCAALTGLSPQACRARMHAVPDYSFEVGVRYLAHPYTRRQHRNDPPKIAAAYNAGSVRYSRRNHWHMLSTGNHIDRFVAAYNAYRTWERRAETGPETRPNPTQEPTGLPGPVRTTTGYVRGRAIRIQVVEINNRPVEVDTARAFLRMRAAAQRDGVTIVIVSGFRTMAEQQRLYQLYLQGRGNLAARPGYSNHQSGHALDLNASAPGVYSWLARRGGSFGFRRTVPSENWHWEYWD